MTLYAHNAIHVAMTRKNWVSYRLTRTVQIDHKRTGRAFKRRRLELGLSYRDAEKLIGVKFSYLCDLENGRRPWTCARFAEYVEKMSKGTA